MTRPPPETRGACDVRGCEGVRVRGFDVCVAFGAGTDDWDDGVDGVDGVDDALLEEVGGTLGKVGTLGAADAGADVSNGVADAEQPAAAPTTKASATTR